MPQKSIPKSPLSLSIYTSLGHVSDPLWRMALKWRQRRGKEHKTRHQEKTGKASQARPAGKLIWLHGVSVGESLALKPLIEEVTRTDPNVHCLLTTSTIGSLEAWENIGLPERTIHQFAPIDTHKSVLAFLDHWRPDAIALSERDFWPGMIRWSQIWASGHVPIFLINSRMSDASLKRRKRAKKLFAALLNGFDQILLQDDHSKINFQKIGVFAEKLHVVGSMKASASPLPKMPQLSEKIATFIGLRPTWLAASTHIKETKNLLKTHQLLKQTHPNMLSIIAPRKPEAVQALIEEAQHAGLSTHKRSDGLTINDQPDLLIVDSIGEMGAWLRAAKTVFMGFSLPDDDTALTGKNPFEALALERLVVHGPCTTNFAESYSILDKFGATKQVQGVEELSQFILEQPNKEAQLAASRAFMARAKEPLEITAKSILEKLN